jgi:hypothetical protein
MYCYLEKMPQKVKKCPQISPKKQQILPNIVASEMNIVHIIENLTRLRITVTFAFTLLSELIHLNEMRNTLAFSMSL